MKRKMQADGKPETAGRSLTGNDGLGRSRGRQETRPPPVALLRPEGFVE